MNFRNRKLIVTVRVILGLFLLMSGVTGFMAGFSHMQGVPPEMVPSSQALWDFGIFQLIKGTETVAGLMLIFGYLPALAVIFVAPIPVGVIIFNSRLAPAYIPTGIILGLLVAYMGYAYWDKYKQLFTQY